MKNLSVRRARRRALMGLAGGLTAALALTACGANSDPQGEPASAEPEGSVVTICFARAHRRARPTLRSAALRSSI